MKNLFFWRLLFQICWQLELLMNQNLGKALLYLKKWGIGINYCWNYGSSKLALHFIEYRLDQLNSTHTKITVNSAIQQSEEGSQKKYPLKVWRFLVHPPQNGGPVKVLRNWTETILQWPIFSNFTNIRHLV